VIAVIGAFYAGARCLDARPSTSGTRTGANVNSNDSLFESKELPSRLTLYAHCIVAALF
jgi:hypothetical protein